MKGNRETLLPYGRTAGLFVRGTVEELSRLHMSDLATSALTPGTRREGAIIEGCSLNKAWELLLPKKFNPDRMLFVQMAGTNWCGCFDNQIYGAIGSSDPYWFAYHGRTETCSFSHRPSEPTIRVEGSATYSHYRWSSQRSNLVQEREVVVLEDSKWSFAANGLPDDFEDHECYSRRSVRARLDPETLIKYGGHLGVSFWRKEAYDSRMVLVKDLPPSGDIESSDQEAGIQEIVSLAERISPEAKITFFTGRGTA